MISYEKQENAHLGKSQPVYRLIVLPDHFLCRLSLHLPSPVFFLARLSFQALYL
jgi:hypothetical protein